MDSRLLPVQVRALVCRLCSPLVWISIPPWLALPWGRKDKKIAKGGNHDQGFFVRCRAREHARDPLGRANRRFQAGHARDAGKPAARRLAHAQSHLRRATFQPAQRDQPRHRRRACARMGARIGGRHQRIHPDRLSGRHVCRQPGRWRARARCHQRRSDLGLFARVSERDDRLHRRAHVRAAEGARDLRGHDLLREPRWLPGGARRAHRQGPLGDQSPGL